MPVRKTPAIRSAPRPKPAPKPKAPPRKPAPANPQNRVTANSASSLSGALPSLLTAGAGLGAAYIGAGALSDTLGQLTENPMLLAAVAGVVVLVLLR